MWACSLRARTGRDGERRAILTQIPGEIEARCYLKVSLPWVYTCLNRNAFSPPVFSKETRDKSFPIGSSEFLKGRESLGPQPSTSLPFLPMAGRAPRSSLSWWLLLSARLSHPKLQPRVEFSPAPVGFVGTCLLGERMAFIYMFSP